MINDIIENDQGCAIQSAQTTTHTNNGPNGHQMRNIQNQEEIYDEDDYTEQQYYQLL
jgi:hypothetical protein